MQSSRLIRKNSNRSCCPHRFLSRTGVHRRLPWLAVVGAAAFAALIAGVQLAHGAGGAIDQSFGRSGRVTTDFNGTTDIAYAVALQPDGKLVVAGTSYANNDYSKEDFAVVRYNSNGTRDLSFGVNGKVTTDFPNLAAVPSALSRRLRNGSIQCRWIAGY